MFNKNSRKKNILMASTVSVLCTSMNMIIGFVYRSIFLSVLSIEYLGLNGLFTNILSVLSLAELGVTASITYHFYKPIADNDAVHVGKLMRFLRHVYNIIFLVITIGGLVIVPFLNYFIQDAGEIPNDINLYIIYCLFLLSTSCSYLFSYKLTILTADQRQYISSYIQFLINMVVYIAQLVVLFMTRNYTLVLFISIVSRLLLNYLFSLWVERKYRNIFRVNESISREEKKEILHEVKGMLCHRIGGTIKTSTDNIVISKFAGLVSVGMYSNYALVIKGLTSIINMLFGSFTSSLGNACVIQSAKENYRLFKRLFFVNMFIGIIVCDCLLFLLDDFICVWVGERMILDTFTVYVICAQFFIECTRQITLSFSNAAGLFICDKARPIIEAFINLVVSIIGIKYLGIAGVFIGTIVSQLVTTSWREPYLLYKHVFNMRAFSYVKQIFQYTVIWMLHFAVLIIIKNNVNFIPQNMIQWFFMAVICFVSATLITFLSFIYKDELWDCVKFVFSRSKIEKI